MKTIDVDEKCTGSVTTCPHSLCNGMSLLWLVSFVLGSVVGMGTAMSAEPFGGLVLVKNGEARATIVIPDNAMELENVPEKIGEVQQRVTQLELAARQLAEETAEPARRRLADINEEMAELRDELVSLREQWEAEKMDAWTKMAAGWTQQYVEKASGAKLTIVAESEAPDGALIAIGHTRLADRAGVTATDLNHDGCKMVVKGNVLYLIGRDTTGCRPSPNSGIGTWSYEKEVLQRYGDTGAKGTCRAATWFLEEICGVRWLMPCPQGTYIPHMKTIAVPSDLNRSFEPFFIYHSNRSLYGSPLSRPAAWANNYRVSTKLYTQGGHPVPNWVPASLFDEHPEYFAMVDGARTPIGNHVCMSNREVQDLIEAGLASHFESGSDLVQLGLADGYQPCECDKCRALDGRMEDLPKDMGLAQRTTYHETHPWDRVNIPQRQIAERLLKRYPKGKYIHWLVYGATGIPSNAYDRLPENCIIEETGGTREAIQKWGRIADGVTVYHYWYDHTLCGGIGVRVSPSEAADMIKFYAASGVRGIHGGGGYNWGLMGMTFYVTGRLMGDPNLKLEELTDQYCNGLYGNAAEAMKSFFALLHTKSDFRLQDREMTIANRFMLYYPPDFVEACEERLQKAEAATVTDREKTFVQVTRDEWDYIRLLTRALALYRGYLVNKDVGDLQQLKEAVQEFDIYRRRMCSYEGEYVRDYFPGHGYLCNFLTVPISGANYAMSWADVKDRTNIDDIPGTGIGFLWSSLGKPLTLNFDGEQVESALKVAWTDQATTLDGKLDEAAWKKATPVFMHGDVKTEVKALYDKDNLYAAFACSEPAIEKMKVQDVARDSDVCLLPCIELFVDPESTRLSQRYYHFIIAATKDAIYDDRTGFNTLGNWHDQDYSWNAPGLRYGLQIDKARKIWTIEMKVPFKDINAPTPLPGQVWLGNVARENPGLQQWSKGGSGGFCDPQSFGRFVFEKP